MPSAEQATRIYQELAEDYERQGQTQMRDRFLVLAADAALAAGQHQEAERLRSRLLQHNPHHLLKPYTSFEEAMKAVVVQNYVSALRKSHPYEKAEDLLEGFRQNEDLAATLSPASPRAKTSPEIQGGPRKEPSKAGEDLKVFRTQEKAEEPKAAPARPPSQVNPASPGTSPPPARPVQPTPSSQAPPAGRPAGAPEILPLRREPYPAMDKLRPAPTELEEPGPGAWVCSGLILLVVLIAILLGVYTFSRPFLPPGWF